MAPFGFQDVSPEERTKNIRAVFQAVAKRYDLMNDLMSFGIHRLWKRKTAHLACLRGGEVAVDLAGGTGDIAALMCGPGRKIVVVDPSVEMMDEGKKRALSGVEWVNGSGEAIPLADNTAHVVTMSFGLRNTTDMDRTLQEVHRILKPGGVFLCLEFSRPAAFIRPFYDAYSYHVIPRLGAFVAKAPIAYTYLVDSIRRFPDQDELKRKMEEAGFGKVDYENLSFGIACIHLGLKTD